MDTPPTTSPRATDLTAGPRGRRLLLEFVLAAEELTRTDDRALPLAGAVFGAVYDAGPSDAVPRLIGTVTLPDAAADPTTGLLATALDQSVCSAMYWEEPDGTDVLCATPPVRRALEPVAEHLAASPLTDWWWSAPDPTDQWTVTWGEDAAPLPTMSAQDISSGLADWRAGTLRDERRNSTSFARRRAPEDAGSGAWWSTPVRAVPASSRTWPGVDAYGDRGPVGALFTEDSPGEPFTAVRLPLPEQARVREITGAADWANLCREFPLEVTWSRRGDWYRTTGRDSREAGPWTIPDWSAVADRWDAVHLTVAGYLAAATHGIPVSTADGRDAASLLAGWGPDVTYRLRGVTAAGTRSPTRDSPAPQTPHHPRVQGLPVR